jgi:hypothetical protein
MDLENARRSPRRPAPPAFGAVNGRTILLALDITFVLGILAGVLLMIVIDLGFRDGMFVKWVFEPERSLTKKEGK